MKMKRYITSTFASLSAVAAVFWLAASVAVAQTTPVFEYDFPASSGTGTTITDVSPAGNNGHYDGTLSFDAPPPGAPGGTLSVDTSAGGILTNADALLTNSAVAAAGGFTMNVTFMWNGTDLTSFGHTQKLIDYAGTESLQLVTTSGSASLQMAFGDDLGNESIPVSTTILPNAWYDATLYFGNTSLTGSSDQDVAGIASLFLNGSLVSQAPATKGTYGDSLSRPIGVGQLGANFGYLVGFKGDIYDPSVALGVPEPSTFALAAVGGLGMMFVVRRRRKS
jgi:hypothetical protein